MFRTIGAIALASLALGWPSTAPSQERQAPPGEGVICAWAIYAVISNVAERCDPDGDPDLRAELRRAVERLDAYMAANTNLTPEQIHAFKVDQAHIDVPTTELCASEAVDLYRGFERGRDDGEVNVQALRSHVDGLVARPGTPTWGTCL